MILFRRQPRAVLEVRKWVVEQAWKFFPDIMIYAGVLDPFKSSPNVTQGDGSEGSTSNASASQNFVSQMK